MPFASLPNDILCTIFESLASERPPRLKDLVSLSGVSKSVQSFYLSHEKALLRLALQSLINDDETEELALHHARTEQTDLNPDQPPNELTAMKAAIRDFPSIARLASFIDYIQTVEDCRDPEEEEPRTGYVTEQAIYTYATKGVSHLPLFPPYSGMSPLPEEEDLSPVDKKLMQVRNCAMLYGCSPADIEDYFVKSDEDDWDVHGSRVPMNQWVLDGRKGAWRYLGEWLFAWGERKVELKDITEHIVRNSSEDDRDFVEWDSGYSGWRNEDERMCARVNILKRWMSEGHGEDSDSE